MKLLDIEEKADLLELWKTNPVKWHNQLFDNTVWDKQKEVLEAVRDHKYSSVKSANTVGKSYIAAKIALWFLSTHHPSKVITTAPTWLQVEGILWKEIGNSYYKSKIPFDAEMLKTELKFSDEWFAIGISTNEVNRFQGFHSPHLLVLIDEALGVAPEIWEAIQGLHPHRILAIGNPLDPSGDFYNCFSSPLWHKITISAEECVRWQEKNGKIPGLVTREWIEERAQEWGKGSPLYQSRVLGEFPEETASTLISRVWVEKARRKVNDGKDGKDVDNEEDSVRIAAADVATKHGECETVITYRYGHTIKEMKGYYRIATTQTAQILKRYYGIKKADSVVVDSDGIGEGVSDILEQARVPVIEFHGGYGQKAIDQNRFKNLRTQFYWIVAKKFEAGLYSLNQLGEKEYELLKNQLCSIHVKAPDAMGRIQIETKEDLATRGIKSPDFSDSYVYAEFGYFMSKHAEIQGYRWR